VTLDKTWRPGPALFAAAVAAHILLLEWLGPSAVLTPKLDANVYLDLARSLWVEGKYESAVGKVYPPGYPMLIAPVFAVASNSLRFALIYALHGLLIGAGSLTLFPALREHLGARGAWIALSAAQGLAGVTIHSIHPRSEALFTALCLAAAGAAWRLGRRSDPGSALLLGLLCGLSLATRRTGIVLIAALVVVFVARALARRSGGLRTDAILAAAAALGVAVGLVPEAVATALHGDALKSYSDGVLGSHLGAGPRALASPRGTAIALDVGATHLVYYVTSTLGMPLILFTALGARRIRDRLDAATLHLAGFTLLATLGLAAASSLHVIRYWLRRDLEAGYDLYPRYLDPMEPGLILVGFALAGATLAGTAKDRLRRYAPALAVTSTLLAAVKTMEFPRGYRLPWPRQISPHVAAEWLFSAEALAVLIVFVALVASGWLQRYRTLVLALLVGWLLSTHLVENWIQSGPARPKMPLVLQLDVVKADPTRTLALVPQKAGRQATYLLSWKTDHDVWIISRDEVEDWVDDHPDGLVLGVQEMPLPLPVVERYKRWVVYGTGAAASPVAPSGL